MKRFLATLLVFIIIISGHPLCFAEQEAPPEVEAQNVLLLDLSTGAVAYEKAADEQIYPASTTKIMTMIIALENCDNLEDIVTVSDHFNYDLIVGSTSITLKEGEQISVRDLLYAVAIASANDAANALAEYVAGDVESFIKMMNDKAAAVGATATHFNNTHGLPDENHYTTARDMAAIMKYALGNDYFRTLNSTYSHVIPATNKTEKRVISTTNSMISSVSSNYYKYACGGKTGTTTAAGYNLVSWASKGNLDFLCVAMHADKESHSSNPIFSDSKKLYEWAFNNFSLQQIVNMNDPQKEIAVELSAQKDYVVVTAKENLFAVLPNDIDLASLEYKFDVPKQVLAPVGKGDEIGKLTVLKDGVTYGTTQLVAGEDISRSAVLYYLYCIRRFFSNLWVQIVGGILLVLLIIYIIIMIKNNRNRRRRQVRLKPRIRY